MTLLCEKKLKLLECLKSQNWSPLSHNLLQRFLGMKCRNHPLFFFFYLLGILHLCSVSYFLCLFSFLHSMVYNFCLFPLMIYTEPVRQLMHVALKIQVGEGWSRVTSRHSQINSIKVIIKYPYFICPCSSFQSFSTLDVSLWFWFLLVSSYPTMFLSHQSVSPAPLSTSWVSRGKKKILCIFLLTQESTKGCFSTNNAVWPFVV